MAWGQEIKREGISGRNFRAIEAAMPELARHQLNVEDYWIEVVDWQESILVMFGTKDRPPFWRGSFGPKPNYSVELSRDDLRVIGSQFSR
jgi:hypothetical protein